MDCSDSDEEERAIYQKRNLSTIINQPSATQTVDELDRWLLSVQVDRRFEYPRLAKMAFDVLNIPPMAAEYASIEALENELGFYKCSKINGILFDLLYLDLAYKYVYSIYFEGRVILAVLILFRSMLDITRILNWVLSLDGKSTRRRRAEEEATTQNTMKCEELKGFKSGKRNTSNLASYDPDD
ncbi:hypothetical protein P885DRAFT_63282 [Corynascus similis CBS 632.67]